MITLYVCRDLYPSWKSTRKYIDGIRGQIGLLPEECLGFSQQWNGDDVARYLQDRELSLVGSLRDRVVVIQSGQVRHYEKDSPPITIATKEGAVSCLVRICSPTLKKSPPYSGKADLLLVSSSLTFPPQEVIALHRHNLRQNSVVLLSNYKIGECYASDLDGREIGETIGDRRRGYLMLTI